MVGISNQSDPEILMDFLKEYSWEPTRWCVSMIVYLCFLFRSFFCFKRSINVLWCWTNKSLVRCGRTVDIANNWFLQCAETSMASHIQKQEQIESLTVEFRFTNYASLFILKNVMFSKAPVWALCLGLVGSSNQILSTSIPFNAAQQFNVTFRGG